MSTIFLMISIFGTVHAQETDIAPNASFTDLDGVAHDIYTYLDSGYTVLLDFSFEFCGNCKQWSSTIGHQIWQEHGPNGDNTVRMFHVDFEQVTDASVANYTLEWGVEYPAVNIQEPWAEYPVTVAPSIYFICPNRNQWLTAGASYPDANVYANVLYNKCQNVDLTSNVSLIHSQAASSHTICQSDNLVFQPELLLMHTDIFDEAVEIDIDNLFAFSAIEENYQIQVFRNNTLVDTQDINPNSDGSINQYDSPLLEPFGVSPNDIITLVCKYPNDTYADDDSLKIVVASEINTPTSSTSQLIISGNSALSYEIRNANGDSLYSSNGNSQLNLNNGSCYQIKFKNADSYSGLMADANNNPIISFEAGEFSVGPSSFSAPISVYSSPWLFFHVNTNGSVNVLTEQPSTYDAIPLSVEYYNIVGEKVNKNNPLSGGIYVEVKRYLNGTAESNKIFIKY
jgi:hypothetical protein